MKRKIISLLMATVICTAQAFAQNAKKEEMDDVVHRVASWLQSTLYDSYVTLEFSPTVWDHALESANQDQAVRTYASLANGIAKFHDKLEETTVWAKCGFVSSGELQQNKPLCEDQIKAWQRKLSIHIKAGNIRYTETSYRLLLAGMGRIASFFGNGDQGIQQDWKPKANNITVNYVVDEKAQKLSVAWNADGTVVTITAPAYTEEPGWTDKLNQGLAKGGSR